MMQFSYRLDVYKRTATQEYNTRRLWAYVSPLLKNTPAGTLHARRTFDAAAAVRSRRAYRRSLFLLSVGSGGGHRFAVPTGHAQA